MQAATSTVTLNGMTMDSVDLNQDSRDALDDYVDSGVHTDEGSPDNCDPNFYEDSVDDFDEDDHMDAYGITCHNAGYGENVLSCSQFRERIQAVEDDKVHHYFLNLIENTVDFHGFEWGNPDHRPHFYPDWLPWVNPAYCPSEYSDEEWVNLLREGIIFIYEQALVGEGPSYAEDNVVEEEVDIKIDVKPHLEAKVSLLRLQKKEIETLSKSVNVDIVMKNTKGKKMKRWNRMVNPIKSRSSAMTIYRSLPEVKERDRLRRSLPEVKERQRLRQQIKRQDPEVREREKQQRRMRRQDPEVREREKQQKLMRRQNPEVRERENQRRRERMQERKSELGVEEKEKQLVQHEVVMKLEEQECNLDKHQQRLERDRLKQAERRMNVQYRERERIRAKERRLKRKMDPEKSEMDKQRRRERMMDPEKAERERQRQHERRMDPEKAEREKQRQRERMMDPEKAERDRQRRRERMMDPARRELENQRRARDRLKKIEQRKDPAFREKEQHQRLERRIRATCRGNEEAQKRLQASIYMSLKRENPEFQKLENEKQRMRKAIKREDPEFRQRENERHNVLLKQKRQDPEFRSREYARQRELYALKKTLGTVAIIDAEEVERRRAARAELELERMLGKYRDIEEDFLEMVQ